MRTSLLSVIFLLTAACANEQDSAVKVTDAPNGITKTCKLAANELNSTEIRFRVPTRDSNDLARIELVRDKALLPQYTVSEGLDFYHRDGSLAIISGGVFEEDFTPVITLRAFFNKEEAQRSGFVEIKVGNASLPTSVAFSDCHS